MTRAMDAALRYCADVTRAQNRWDEGMVEARRRLNKDRADAKKRWLKECAGVRARYDADMRLAGK